jgi:hypothetical protein
MAKPIEDNEWEWYAALLPLRFDDHVAPGGGVKTTPGRPVLMKYADQAQRRRFLAALLELPWLPLEVRRAVAKELGGSLRLRKKEYEAGRTHVFSSMVAEVEARMRAASQRPPKGDIHTAAIEQVAEKVGIGAEALMKRMQRIRRPLRH